MGVFADRVKESSSTTGTGNFTLSGTSTGYRTFNNAIGINVRCYYCIAHQTANEWEVGEGYLSDATTFVRSEIMSSSNANTLVNFSTGTKDVFCTVPAKEVADKALFYASRMNLVGV